MDHGLGLIVKLRHNSSSYHLYSWVIPRLSKKWQSEHLMITFATLDNYFPSTQSKSQFHARHQGNQTCMSMMRAKCASRHLTSSPDDMDQMYSSFLIPEDRPLTFFPKSELNWVCLAIVSGNASDGGTVLGWPIWLRNTVS